MPSFYPIILTSLFLLGFFSCAEQPAENDPETIQPITDDELNEILGESTSDVELTTYRNVPSGYRGCAPADFKWERREIPSDTAGVPLEYDSISSPDGSILIVIRQIEYVDMPFSAVYRKDHPRDSVWQVLRERMETFAARGWPSWLGLPVTDGTSRIKDIRRKLSVEFSGTSPGGKYVMGKVFATTPGKMRGYLLNAVLGIYAEKEQSELISQVLDCHEGRL